jgi:hypothetical protein
MNIEIDSNTRRLIEFQLTARKVDLERKIKNIKGKDWRKFYEHDLAQTVKILKELKVAKKKALQELVKK